MSIVRSISALALASTLPVSVMPLPVHAAGREAATSDRTLTLNGLPLSQLASSTETGASLRLASLVKPEKSQAGTLPQRASVSRSPRQNKILLGALIGGGVGAVVGEYGFGRGFGMSHGPDIALGVGIGAGLGGLIAALATD